MHSKLRPLIFWEGFPPCGLLTKKVADAFGDQLVLLGTKAAVPFEGLEELLAHQIQWLDNADDIWERRHEFSDRNFIIHTGWAHKGWLRFDRWMKKRGATIIFAADNSFKGNLRQWVGAAWFRLWLRQHFDAAFVPGHSSTTLMRFLGMPAHRIFTGYYGAYEEIYKAGLSILERKKEFLFVGQLIPRKGLDVLLDAFSIYRKSGGDWNLRILGSGPMQSKCHGDGIIFEGFAQAQLASQRMRETRCLVLPSREDHWGTVVCEAAASGAMLITSRWVGAAQDLVRSGINGFVFHEMSAKSLAQALISISQWDNNMLINAQRTSQGLAQGYTSASYFSAFQEMSKINKANTQS